MHTSWLSKKWGGIIALFSYVCVFPLICAIGMKCALWFDQEAPPALVNYIRAKSGIDLRVKRMSVDWFGGGLSLRDVELYDKLPGRPPIAYCPKVSVRGLFNNRISVKVLRPKLILIQDSQGVWNIKRALPLKKGKPGTKVTEITISDGDFSLAMHKRRIKPATLHVSKIYAKILNTSGVTTFTVDSSESDSTLHALGSFSSQGTLVSYQLKNWPMDTVHEFISSDVVKAHHAMASTNGRVWVGHGSYSVDGKGHIDAQELSLRLNSRMQLLGKASGVVIYDQNHVQLAVEHSLADGNGVSNVQIAWHPSFTVQGKTTFKDINSVKLTHQLGMLSNIPQFGTSSGKLSYSFDHEAGLILSGPVRFQHIKWNGYEAGSGQADIAYKHNILRIDNGLFKVGKTGVHLDGYIPFNGKPMQLSAKGDELDIGGLKTPMKLPKVTGKASVSAAISGPTKDPKVDLRVQAKMVRYRGYAARRIDAAVNIDRKQAYLRSLWVKTDIGRLWASGRYTMSNRRVEARYGIEGVPIKTLISPGTAGQQVRGNVFSTGRISGKISQPDISSRIMALDVQYGRWQLDMLSVYAEVKNGNLKLNQGSARRTIGLAQWDGTVNNVYTPSRSFDIRGYFSNWDIAELASMAAPDKPNESLPDGLIKAEVNVVGTIQDPTVTVQMTSNNITYDDVNLRDVVLDGSYNDKLFRIYQVSGRFPDGELNASGVIRHGADYRIAGTFSGLALRAFRRYLPNTLPQDLAGQAKADFRVMGTDDGPRLTADVELSQVSWDGLSIDKANGKVSMDNGKVAIDNLGANAYGGRIDAPQITYTMATRTLTSIVKLSGLDISALSAALVSGRWINQKWPEARKNLQDLNPVAGKLSLVTNVEGEVSKLDSYATIDAKQLMVRGVDGLNINVGLRSRADGSVQLKPISLKGTGINMSGEALASAEGSLTGHVELQDLDLSRLQPAVPQASDLAGTLNAFASIGGTTNSPSGTLVCSVKDPACGGIKLKSITSEPISLVNGKINIPRIVVSLENGQATISGDIQMPTETLKWSDKAIVDMSVDAPKQELSSLMNLFKMPDGVRVKGDWSAGIKLTGSFEKPQLSGGMNLSDCTVSAYNDQIGLKNITAKINLAGQQIKLTDASAEPIGGGGRLLLGASVDGIFGKTPQLNTKLTLNQLSIDQRNLSKKYNERIRGVFDGYVAMGGTLQQPRISGKVTVSKFGLSLPNGFEFAQNGVKPSLDPTLDGLQLSINNDAEVELPRFKAKGGGQINLAGRLSDPQLRGDLRLSQGRILLPTTVFNVQPPAVIALAYPIPGNNPFNIDVSMRATAMVSVASYGSNASRHEVTMELQGPLGDSSLMQASFKADPADVSQQDIYDALGLGMIRNVVGGKNNAIGNGVVDLISNQFVPQLLNPIELGLEDTFRLQEVNIGYQHDQPLSVTLVKQLGSGFSLSYWRQFESVNDRYVTKLSYELPRWLKVSPRLRLTASSDEQNIISYGLEGSIRF